MSPLSEPVRGDRGVLKCSAGARCIAFEKREEAGAAAISGKGAVL